MLKALAGNFDYLKILKELEFCFDFFSQFNKLMVCIFI